MQKEVLIFMTSIQRGGTVGEDKLEVITAGQYYLKNGKHYITYEDVSEDGRTRERNIIKIREDRAEVIKKGETSVHMIFEKDKKNYSCYDVPYGKMMVGLETSRMEVTEEEDRLELRLEYRLEMDDQHIADCLVEIRVESKDTCKVDLS